MAHAQPMFGLVARARAIVAAILFVVFQPFAYAAGLTIPGPPGLPDLKLPDPGELPSLPKLPSPPKLPGLPAPPVALPTPRLPGPVAQPAPRVPGPVVVSDDRRRGEYKYWKRDRHDNGRHLGHYKHGRDDDRGYERRRDRHDRHHGDHDH